MYYVYHIRLPGHGLDEGYVGISKRPKTRWSDHKSRKENPILSRAISKYGPKLGYKILGIFETVEDALWQEYTLRPLDRMGWNLVKGGGMPPDMGGWNKGKPTSDAVKEKQSKVRSGRFGGLNHPRNRSANIYDLGGNLIAENVCISVWAKENNYHQGHLSSTARGELKQHKGVYARYVEKDNNVQPPYNSTRTEETA